MPGQSIDPASSSFHTFGAHTIRVVAPNRVAMAFNGKVSVSEAREIVSCLELNSFARGPLFIKICATHFQSSGNDTRQVFVTAKCVVAAAAIWGASFSVQMAMSMVIKAASFLAPRLLACPLAFVSTEAEADAMLQGVAGKGR